eukprot:jgi/Psemu1/323836/estExt_fgenesh1_pg.C_990005
MADASRAAITNNGSRRGASRKVRVYVFREWLLKIYGTYLSEQQQQQQQQRRLAFETENNAYDSDDDADESCEHRAAGTSGMERTTSICMKRKRMRRRCSGNEFLVLDVAGGKGDLSWLLKNVDGLESIVMDPWKPDPGTKSRNERMTKSIEYLRSHPEEAEKRSIPFLPTYQPLAALMPRLMAERRKRLLARKDQTHNNSSACANNTNTNNINPRSLSLSTPANAKSESASNDSLADSNTSSDSDCCRPGDFLTPRLLQVPLDEKLLIVGFHPDQATEPCVDLARVLSIPFCIVPCCVFPSEFLDRRLRVEHLSLPEGANGENSGAKDRDDDDDDEDHRQGLEMVPVRTYHQFLEYLQQKPTNNHSKIHTAHLDFPFTETAKNIVLYTLPPSPPTRDGAK